MRNAELRMGAILKKTMEKILNILPIIIMVECLAASVPYFVYKNWGSAIYWLAAGVLNFSGYLTRSTRAIMRLIVTAEIVNQGGNPSLRSPM